MLSERHTMILGNSNRELLQQRQADPWTRTKRSFHSSYGTNHRPQHTRISEINHRLVAEIRCLLTSDKTTTASAHNIARMTHSIPIKSRPNGDGENCITVSAAPPG
jgi:hydroxylamine reductase (hybrid-cluster protein)